MILGYSVARRPLVAELVGTPPVGLFVFGAIHGDEPESAILCERFLAHLRERPTNGAATLILPVANPDGLAARSKDNARGVDLNRNFAARSWSAEHPPRYYPGAAPLSEPETLALAEAIDRFSPRVLVAVHQPFRCINWDGPAEELARQMSAASGYPMHASVGYPTPGSFGSFYGLDRSWPVITLELPRQVEEADYRGCLAALDCARVM